MAKYTAEEFVVMVMEKKVPLLVRHGVIAVWEGTRRKIKKTAGGTYRTQQRIPASKRVVTKDKQGLVDAFNIIMTSFNNYGFLQDTTSGLTGKGRNQNVLHLREVDSRRRTMLFQNTFNKLMATEIAAYKERKGI